MEHDNEHSILSIFPEELPAAALRSTPVANPSHGGLHHDGELQYAPSKHGSWINFTQYPSIYLPTYLRIYPSIHPSIYLAI